VGLATDTHNLRVEARKVNKLTSTLHASDSSWHPGHPGRPLFGRLELRLLHLPDPVEFGFEFGFEFGVEGHLNSAT